MVSLGPSGNGTGSNSRGENDGLADHLALGIRGDSNCVASRAGLGTNESVLVGRCPASVTDVAFGHLVILCVGSGSSQHAETLRIISNRSCLFSDNTCLLKSGRLAAGDVVDVETALVDELALGTTISGLRNTDVGSVLVVEEHNSSPVVRLVLNEAARCASGQLSRVIVGVHSHVEAIAANDLVEMGSVLHPRVDEGICSLNNKL